jgi:hypothetical protein
MHLIKNHLKPLKNSLIIITLKNVNIKFSLKCLLYCWHCERESRVGSVTGFKEDPNPYPVHKLKQKWDPDWKEFRIHNTGKQ